MIIDKLGDYIYERASLLLTKWRVGCFLITCLILSEAIFDTLSLSFWQGGVSDAAKSLSKITDLPLYLFCIITAMAFAGSPIINKHISLIIINRELSHIQSVITEIETKATKVEADSIHRYRDRAINGEKRIQQIRGLCETLIYLSALGLITQWHSDIKWFYYPILFIVPFLLFFSTQELLAIYLRDIYFYKKLAEFYSKHKEATSRSASPR